MLLWIVGEWRNERWRGLRRNRDWLMLRHVLTRSHGTIFLWNWDQVKKLTANRDFAFGSSSSATPKQKEAKIRKSPNASGLGED
ncbi:hypothetical protein [Paenibacillus elgii]|uniref:hypothetical protein n=1 Tax=Paenibacillus elgii TaxID=189691 RepID=UPI0030D7D7D2